MTTTIYSVAGMNCGNCVAAVTEEVSRLDGVRDVTVELAPQGDSRVTVDSDAELAEADVRAAVEEAGYALTRVTG